MHNYKRDNIGRFARKQYQARVEAQEEGMSLADAATLTFLLFCGLSILGFALPLLNHI